MTDTQLNLSSRSLRERYRAGASYAPVEGVRKH
jgi:hypothetical protein